MRARDQSSIFSTGGKFRPDYGLLLELHALTLVACSYALLQEGIHLIESQHNCFGIISLTANPVSMASLVSRYILCKPQLQIQCGSKDQPVGCVGQGPAVVSSTV